MCVRGGTHSLIVPDFELQSHNNRDLILSCEMELFADYRIDFAADADAADAAADAATSGVCVFLCPPHPPL